MTLGRIKQIVKTRGFMYGAITAAVIFTVFFGLGRYGIGSPIGRMPIQISGRRATLGIRGKGGVTKF